MSILGGINSIFKAKANIVLNHIENLEEAVRLQEELSNIRFENE